MKLPQELWIVYTDGFYVTEKYNSILPFLSLFVRCYQIQILTNIVRNIEVFSQSSLTTFTFSYPLPSLNLNVENQSAEFTLLCKC